MNTFVYKWTPKLIDLLDKHNGRAVSSPIFHTLANDTFMYWQIDFYPNGRSPLCLDKSSIFLRLAGANVNYGTISAKFQFELMTSTATMESYHTPMSQQHDFRLNTINNISLCFPRFAPNLANIDRRQLLLLGEDRLLIKCTIEMPRVAFKSSASETYLTTAPSTTPKSKLTVSFENVMFHLPDVVFVTKDGNKFYCHRNILGEKCMWFKRLLKLHDLSVEIPDVTVANISEDKAAKIYNLNAVDAEVFVEIIRYIYTELFNVEKLRMIASRVLPLAELYFLPLLRSKCSELMIETLASDNAVDFLILADKHKLEELKKKCVTLIVDELKEIKDEKGWKPLLRSHPHLVEQIFDEVATHNVLAAF